MTTRVPEQLEPGADAAEHRTPTAARGLAWLLIVGGGLGLLAAFDLTVERIRLLVDPSYVPTCSINPVLSCGSVMVTDQARVLGFPNSLLGIAGFAVVVTVGAALLAGARFRPWFWIGLLTGETVGALFVHWLIFQSLYRIGALCPYCMVVWAVTIPLLLFTFRHAADSGLLGDGVRARSRWLVDYAPVVLVGWYGAVVVLVLLRFWTELGLG